MANEEENNVRYDLGTFVVSVTRLKTQGRPVMVLFNAILNLIRWKHPYTSFIVIPTALVMIILWPEYLMGLMLTPLPLLMLVNLIKRLGTKKTVVIDYQKFFVRKDEPLELIARRNAMLKAREHLDMYLKLLIEIQELCNSISAKFEFFYSLYYWEAWKRALLFYILVICSIIGLFTIRIRFMVAALLFSLSVFNAGFKKVVLDVFTYIYNSPSRLFKSKKDIATESCDEDDEIDDVQEEDLDIQVKEQYPAEDSIANSSSSSDSESVGIKPERKSEPLVQFDTGQEKQREKHGLSFVSKIASSTLASIRRRKTGGKCASCNAVFSSILKKRHYCRHCGYSYCSNCCHKRVPRVVFGATAPAAYEERVLVCNSCHAYLKNRMRGTNTEIID